VEEIARGRVWTGAQAHEMRLVDELGDFETALVAAKELAGLQPERDYTVVQVRPPRHELLPHPISLGGERGSVATGLGAVLDALQGLAHERTWALAPWMVRVWG
jgi:protease-4